MVAHLAEKPSTPKVVHSSQVLQFTPRPECACQNDLGIPDQEFFTAAFVQKVTNHRYDSITHLLANRWQSLDQIIQLNTAFPDFESFKLAAFANYLHEHQR